MRKETRRPNAYFMFLAIETAAGSISFATFNVSLLSYRWHLKLACLRSRHSAPAGDILWFGFQDIGDQASPDGSVAVPQGESLALLQHHRLS